MFYAFGGNNRRQKSFAVIESRFWCLYEDKSCDRQSKFRLKRPLDAEVQLMKRRTRANLLAQSAVVCDMSLILEIFSLSLRVSARAWGREHPRIGAAFYCSTFHPNRELIKATFRVFHK